MTYAAQETSVESGQPVELYLFTIGSAPYAYSSAEDTITKSTIRYAPESISRTEIKVSKEKEDDQVEITVPESNAFVQNFFDIPPGDRSTLTIREFHRTDGIEQIIISFKGFVQSVRFDKQGDEAIIIARSITSANARTGPRHTFQTGCNNHLFDARCGLSKAAFEQFGTVAAVSGRFVTVTGISNIGGGSDYWQAGTIQALGEHRLIYEQNLNVFTMLLPFRGATVGSTVRLLPGCKHRRVLDCATKFNNFGPSGGLNYSGCDWIPQKNIHQTGL